MKNDIGHDSERNKPKAGAPRRRGKRLLVPGNPKASKQLNKGKQDQKKLAPKSPKVESRGDEKSASNGEIATKGKAGDMPDPKIRKSPVKVPNKKKDAHITVMADEPPRMGRPTKYSQEIADEICELVAIRTPLFKICEMPHMPTERTVYCWRRDRGDFSQSYARAKEHRAESRSDRIDWIADRAGRGELTSDVARVMIDAEKWQASKENQRFSDRQTTEIKGKLDVEHQKVDDLELARWVAHVLTNGVRAQEKLGGVLDISKLIDGSNATDIEGE